MTTATRVAEALDRVLEAVDSSDETIAADETPHDFKKRIFSFMMTVLLKELGGTPAPDGDPGNPKPGDHFVVHVGGLPYQTVIDEHGRQRFLANGVIRHLLETGRLDLKEMAFASERPGTFAKRDYAEFCMMLGYTVNGFAEMSQFHDYVIQNPLWDAR